MVEKKGLIIAAGGLIWKKSTEGDLLAVIHRTRYGDEWSLPKGKVAEGESPEKTARREVQEETGFKVEIREYAGSIEYRAAGFPKIVLFWNMELAGEDQFVPNEEVDDLRWVKLTEAIDLISYPEEKALLDNKNLGGPRFIFMKITSILRRFFLSLKTIPFMVMFKSNRYKRLYGDLLAYKEELGHRIQRAQSSGQKDMGWAKSARRLLNQVEIELKSRNIDEGWKCFAAAKRMEIYNLTKTELITNQFILSREATKLNEWRKNATYKLLGQPESPKKEINREDVFQATLLRDEHYDNGYYKIALMRSQLGWLALIFLILLLVIASYLGNLPMMDRFHSLSLQQQIWGIFLFGLLGATFSAIFKLRDSSSLSRIPELLGDFSMTLVRVLIGAGSALIIYLFLQLPVAGNILNGLNIQLKSAYAFLAISFVAGFTERLLLKAVQTIAGKDK